jgi:hypothetical protein
MASFNTLELRREMAALQPREQHVIRRALVPVGKSGRMRLQTSVAPQAQVDARTGVHTNPARALTETQRRELGLRRNGRPRRPAKAAG